MAHAQLASNISSGVYRDPRVSYWLQPGERLVQCPYDKHHWILKMIFHLTKCRHNYENAVKSGRLVVNEEEEMVVCPFNTLHHMARKDLDKHKGECPFNNERDKLKMEKDWKLVVDQVERENKEKEMPQSVSHRGCGVAGGQGQGVVDGSDEDEAEACGSRGYDPRPSGRKRKRAEAAGGGTKNKKLTPEEKKDLERFASPEQAKNPEYNWELVLDQNMDTPRKKFMSYDPEEYMKLHRHNMITNPQGLTKSERRAYHAEMGNLRMIEEEARLKRENEPEDYEPPVFKGRVDLTQTRKFHRKTVPRPGFPGYQLPLDMQVPPPAQEHRNNYTEGDVGGYQTSTE